MTRFVREDLFTSTMLLGDKVDQIEMGVREVLSNSPNTPITAHWIPDGRSYNGALKNCPQHWGCTIEAKLCKKGMHMIAAGGGQQAHWNQQDMIAMAVVPLQLYSLKKSGDSYSTWPHRDGESGSQPAMWQSSKKVVVCSLLSHSWSTLQLLWSSGWFLGQPSWHASPCWISFGELKQLDCLQTQTTDLIFSCCRASILIPIYGRKLKVQYMSASDTVLVPIPTLLLLLK